MSAAISALNRSGGPDAGSLPSARMRCAMVGSATSAMISELSRAVTFGGSLGPDQPIQDVTEKPGKPASAMVPMSGSRETACRR